MGRAERLVKSTFIFGVGTFGSKVLVMLIIPFCTYYVDAVGMGTYDLIYMVSELLKVVGVLCIPEALFRWTVDKSGDYGPMLSSWLALYLILIAVFSLCYWVTWTIFDFADAMILYVMICSGSFYLGVQFGVRGVQRNSLFAAQGIIYAALMCALSYCFVVIFGFGYKGLLFGIVIATLLTSLFCIVKVPEFRSLSLDVVSRRDMLRMLSYAVPLIPNQISWWCINGISRIAIVSTIGLAANGIYAVASKFPTAINMVSTIFQMAWQEQAVLEYESADRDKFYTRVFRVLSRLLISSLFVLLPAIALFIVMFTDPSYSGAKNIAVPLSYAALFTAFSSFYGTLYMCSKETGGAALTTVVGAASAFILNFALVRPFGLMGVAVAVAISQLIVWVFRLRATQRYARIGIDVPQLLTMFVISGVFSGVVLNTTSPVVLFTLCIAGGISFLVANKEIIAPIISKVIRHS